MTDLKKLAKEIIMQMPEMTDVVNDPNSNESTVLVKEELLIFIESALQKVRDETIETAIEIVNKHMPDGICIEGPTDNGVIISTEIRALKSKPEGER